MQYNNLTTDKTITIYIYYTGLQRATLGVFRRPRDRGRSAPVEGGGPVAQLRSERENVSTHRRHLRALCHGGSVAGTRRRDQRHRQGLVRINIYYIL